MIPCKTELKKYRAKNSKILKRIWIKPCSKTRSDKSTCANILTVLFRHFLGMNATSCYWSYIDFYTLITYNYILTDTSNSDTEFISRPLTCLKNFENFTGKHLCRSLFSTKLQAFRPKKNSYTGVFLWNLRNSEGHLFWRISEGLLLCIDYFIIILIFAVHVFHFYK